jgi:WhiB family redox-sensing transcriptional regulator
MTLTDFHRPNSSAGTAIAGDIAVDRFPNTLDLEQEHAMLIDTDPRSILLEPREPDSPRPPGEAATQRTPVARCADGHGTLSALFFSDNVIDIARAKAMCGLCPLQAECLSGALERQEPWGVWGGELLSGGRIIANKRPCGRPPKHPRPEMVIDELGPVGVPVAVA